MTDRPNYSLTLEQASEWLRYEPETGNLYWAKSPRNGILIGDIAGSVSRRGYLTVMIGCRAYKAHRLAFLLYHGRSPEGVIDHANGDISDNRISNLRDATLRQNSHNRKKRIGTLHPLKGIRYRKDRSKWQALITVDGKRLHLGTFNTAADAHQAYCSAAKEHFGQFARAA